MDEKRDGGGQDAEPDAALPGGDQHDGGENESRDDALLQLLAHQDPTAWAWLDAAEAALAAGKDGQGLEKALAGGNRARIPQEEKFRIGRLPQQEVRQPLLPAGADDEVGIGMPWVSSARSTVSCRMASGSICRP